MTGLSERGFCVLLTLCSTLGIAAPLTVDVESQPPRAFTGNSHYVDRLLIRWGETKPLILRSDPVNDRLVPIPGPQFPLGDHDVLLLGWSSTGYGMETLHALLLHADAQRIRLVDEFQLTQIRSASVLVIRREGPERLLLGLAGPIDDQSEAGAPSLTFGRGRTQQLDPVHVRKLHFVDESRRETDLVYAPTLREARFPARMAWFAADAKGYSVMDAGP